MRHDPARPQRPRAPERILKVARTIADLEHTAHLEPKQIAQAIQCCGLDRTYWRRALSFFPTLIRGIRWPWLIVHLPFNLGIAIRTRNPGSAFCAMIVPRCSRTARFAMDNPRPIPPVS